jgi:DNA helicase-2/ATP-dependent DNA helicase PcrA
MEFNELQQKIIKNIYGAYLVSAPVGTGKTMVLAERVIQALDNGIKPEEILCLTFTNRAVEEMMERIKRRIGKKEIYDSITIKTFHGFCAFFVRAEAKSIGISPDFVVFDESEQFETMKNILDEYPGILMNSQNSKRQVTDLIDKIYSYRLNKLEQKIGCAVNDFPLDKTLKEIGGKYIKALNDQNALDFNELVILTIETLYLNKKIKNKWAERYKFIQLDEFQDTHLSEYLVLKELAKTHKNIALIGDLDQTIYSWRGSRPFFIAKLFKKHFAPVEELNLEINYRFNKNILGAIKSFLANFEKPATKEIKSLNNEKEEKSVDLFAGYNLSEEISWVIDNIKDIKNNEKGASIAVLARSNYLINQVADIFVEKNIAHITVDKYDFFRRQEVKDIYGYLKIIFNKFDLESACRIVMRPARNIGISTLKNIREKGAPVGLKVSDFLNFKNFSFIEPFDGLIEKWHSGRIVVLDTETTGTNALKDDIIQIYAVEVVNGRKGKDFHFYLKNSIPVGYSREVHGIDDEFLQENGREAKAVLQELKEFINGGAVAGHNINFDLSMITENAKRNKIIFEFKEYYDTLDLSRRFIESESYKLTSIAKLLRLEGATHDAKDDVSATVGLLEILVSKLKTGREQRSALFKEHKKKFIQLSNLINSWGKIAKEKRPADFLDYVWESSGLKEYYGKDKESQSRLKSTETLRNLFKEKDDLSKQPEVMLRELINYGSLVKDINFLGLEKGKIPIITVHQAKGLEFDYVFLIGINESKFMTDKGGMEEEKRIFYVAMTRARKKIFISYSNFDNYNRPLSKSRFINFIDRKYINYL